MPVTVPVSREEILGEVQLLPEESLAPLSRYISLLRGEMDLQEFEQWAFSLPRKYGFSELTEEDIAGIVRETRAEEQ